MRKILLATTAIAFIAAPAAFAQEEPAEPMGSATNEATEMPSEKIDETETESTGLGAAAGGATGAVAGAAIGGPIGAIVGGFAGAVIGAESAAPQPVVDYAVANPVEPVTVEGEVTEGHVVPESATLHEVPDHPDYAYVYIDGRPVIVSAQNRQVVYSPGYAIPERTITYVESNPLDPVTVDVDLTAGATVPQEVEVVSVPESPAYGYIYTDQGPVLVNMNSRTVVWTQ